MSVEAELAKRAAPFVVVGVLTLTVLTAFGAVFMFGRQAGLKAGAAQAAQAVERVSRDLGTCTGNVATLKAGIATQNAALEAQARAAAQSQAKAEAATARARTEAEAHRKRAAKLLSLSPEGSDCQQAETLLQSYGAE